MISASGSVVIAAFTVKKVIMPPRLMTMFIKGFASSIVPDNI